MYQVYGYPRTRSTRILWMLEELGQKYQFHKVDLVTGAGQSPEFLRINPDGKVPVLIDGDFTLRESGAILAYLGDRHSEAGLVPAAGTRQRGSYDQWSYFVLTELEQPLWTMAKHRFALPDHLKVPQVLETARYEFERACKILEKGLGTKGFLLGDQFSAADILAAHTLAWAIAYKVPPESERLKDYAKIQMQRPAWTRARQREDL
jgi:glutathione S-transferase